MYLQTVFGLVVSFEQQCSMFCNNLYVIYFINISTDLSSSLHHVMNVGGDKKLKFLTCEKEIVVKMETFECHSFLLEKFKYVEASAHINCQPRLPKLTFEVCNIHTLGWNTLNIFCILSDIFKPLFYPQHSGSLLRSDLFYFLLITKISANLFF